MRIARSLTLGLVALAAMACNEDNGPQTPTIPPLAFVRYINAVPDTFNTTVRWIDQVEFTPQTFVNVPFRAQGQGGYQGLQAGTRRFRVFTADVATFSVAGNTQVLVDTAMTFEAGKYYTLLHLGFARAGQSPRQRIIMLTDERPTPGAQIAVRAIHAGLGIANVDIFATATVNDALTGVTPIFSNVPFQAVSNYATRAPGAFATRIAAAGTTTALISTAAPAGVAGTTADDPIGGATVAGSVITAIAFPARPQPAPVGGNTVNFTTPGIGYFIDRQPPRTTAP